MKTIVSKLLVFLLVANAGAVSAQSTPPDALPSSKVYVALEKEGKVAVINGDTQELVQKIDLGNAQDGNVTAYMAHNVQVSPDGSAVWVTANAGMDEHGEANAESESMHMPAMSGSMDMRSRHPKAENDEVVVIDPKTDSVVKRMEIAPGAHLAHVVFSPDGKYAYVTAQKTGSVYKIDTVNYGIKKIDLPNGSGPHGMRVDSTGKKAYIALMAGKGLAIFDLASDTAKIVPLDGMAVQTAVLPNGKWVFVSLYDTKKLALYNVETGKLTYVPLPKTSQGPVQLYPAPDGYSLYVADQGHLSGRPDNARVYKLDFVAMKIRTIPVGKAPHGIVVSADGKRAYVTNLVGGSVSIIDTKTNREIKRIDVGEEPNGISEWTKK